MEGGEGRGRSNSVVLGLPPHFPVVRDKGLERQDQLLKKDATNYEISVVLVGNGLAVFHDLALEDLEGRSPEDPEIEHRTNKDCNGRNAQDINPG